MSDVTSRRAVLRGCGVTLTVATLSGCQGVGFGTGSSGDRNPDATPLSVQNNDDKKHEVTVTVEKKESGDVYKEKTLTVAASSTKKVERFVTDRGVYTVSASVTGGKSDSVEFEGDGVLGVRDLSVTIAKDGLVTVSASYGD